MKKLLLALLSIAPVFAQSTSNDLFVMVGSDFVRPGLTPRANLNIGYGKSFDSLKHNPIFDELTFSYTYENTGTRRGFWHNTKGGAHTSAFGLMKNFNVYPKGHLTGYTWVQGGVTSLTGGPMVKNLFYNGDALGLILHLDKHNSIWFQEEYNKIWNLPWYTASSIGYGWSW